VENRLAFTPNGDGAFSRFRMTESGVSPAALPGTPGGMFTATGLEHDERGNPCAEPVNRTAMLDKRARKMARALEGQDELVRWWGIQELYTDMLDRPALVHAGIARMMEAYLSRLDQLEALGLLSVGNGNYRVGSGGLGITGELPQPDYDGKHARPIDQWGTSTGQIFSSVSPAMHDEFCLQYELRWLERFGLNCYGCCEPLHHKIKMIKKIPRLRRVSMSPWVNVEKGVEAIGKDYIFSYKPTPYIFTEDAWNPGLARRILVEVLEKTRGCCVELIMKDVSTCRRDPQRLWDWCRIAMDVVEDFA